MAVLALALGGCGGGSSEAPGGPVAPGPEPTDPTEPIDPGQPTPWEWDLPPGFPRPLVPADNPMTVEKVELGRHLFYDRRLSLNETQSCADCHAQERGFTDGRPLAVGSTGETHPRNTSGLTNVAYNSTLTWMNPLLTTMEEQVLGPLFSEEPVELGFAGREEELFDRLRGIALYRRLFAEAFLEDDEPIRLERLVQALASFQRTFISGNSPYDRYVYQQDDDALSDSAKRGLDLFNSEFLECTHCHGGANFASSLTHEGNPNDPTPFENNGLYNVGGTGEYPWPNLGLAEFTGEARDFGKMKPPSLRNVEVTGPYMHDGSMATLEEVLRHYERGGRLIEDGPWAGDGKESPAKSSFLTGFPLNDQQRQDLLAFLRSLTDRDFLTDPRLSNPFPTE